MLISSQHTLRHTQDQVQPNAWAPRGPGQMARELAFTHRVSTEPLLSQPSPTALPTPPQASRQLPVPGY